MNTNKKCTLHPYLLNIFYMLLPLSSLSLQGVAFVDANVGYIPIDANGVGTSIQKSTDGGVTWTDDETSAPFSLLLLDIAANNNNVAVIGALSLCV